MNEKLEKNKKAISDLYIELSKLAHKINYEGAIKISNKILNLDSQQLEAFHYKIICLIQLSRFEEAINVMNRNVKLSENLLFEKAYCLYRINKHKEAFKILEKPQQEPKFNELKAQVLYRLEDYKASESLYREIIRNADDYYEEERQTNLAAVLAYINEPQSVKSVEKLISSSSTYELDINKACILANHGKYNEAEKILKCCEKIYEEEASEEEIDKDLALIRVQLAYIYQKQGRNKEAQQLYTTTLKSKLDDVALIAVASNNTVCINKDQNLFDSKKKMKAALNEGIIHKLPSQQRKYITLNNAILNYYLSNFQQSENICKDVEKTWPELSTITTVLKALIFFKDNKFNDAVHLLENSTSSNEYDNLYIKLCLTQLYLMKGDKIKACQILENLGQESYKPGIVGALTTLYLGLSNEQKALEIFEKSVNFYKTNKIKNMDLSSMWRQAADFHIRNGHPQVAVSSLEELLKTNENDKKIIAQLILACAQIDKDKAMILSKQLPTIEELSQGLDIDTLQISFSSTSNNMKKSPGVKYDSQPGTPKSDSATIKKHKHKKRKGKLPKNYVEGIVPDPERWLPKYERTGFRKKRDRRARDIIKGSQGQTTGQSEQFDFSSKVSEQETDSSKVEPSPKFKPQFHQKRNQGKKKNKRR